MEKENKIFSYIIREFGDISRIKYSTIHAIEAYMGLLKEGIVDKNERIYDLAGWSIYPGQLDINIPLEKMTPYLKDKGIIREETPIGWNVKLPDGHTFELF